MVLGGTTFFPSDILNRQDAEKKALFLLLKLKTSKLYSEMSIIVNKIQQ